MTDTADRLAERLLQVIDEGRRTATYKLALLTALIDACAAGADNDGHAPSTLHTRAVAHHVLGIYLPQARTYLGGSGDPLNLRQITTRKSAVLGAVLRLHSLADQHRLRSTTEIARLLPEEYDRCLDEVERTFARYPIRLLQTVGQDSQPFLYEVDWNDSVSLAKLHADGGGLIRFVPGAGDHLLSLAPLLRPLIELHWTRMVAKINHIDIESERLHDHLFGAERVAFPEALRSGLAELQGGACFYCNDALARRTQIDHFIPWARWPNNAVENLVLADACNTHKQDYPPALLHVENWSHRLSAKRAELAELAAAARWESNPARSLSLARTWYAHLPAGTRMWLARDRFTDDDPAAATSRLADLKDFSPNTG